MHDFFHIVSEQKTELGMGFSIRINPQHEVFKGHFPQRAVVPGVMLMHIAKELIALSLNQHVRIGSVKRIKFPAPLFPDSSVELLVTLEFEAENKTWRTRIANEEGIYMQAVEIVLK